MQATHSCAARARPGMHRTARSAPCSAAAGISSWRAGCGWLCPSQQGCARCRCRPSPHTHITHITHTHVRTLTRMPAALSAAVSWSTAASTALRSVSFFTMGTITTCVRAHGACVPCVYACTRGVRVGRPGECLCGCACGREKERRREREGGREGERERRALWQLRVHAAHASVQHSPRHAADASRAQHWPRAPGWARCLAAGAAPCRRRAS